MAQQIDARGLLCPEPVLRTKKEIDRIKNGIFTVIVDNNPAKENISRLAKNSGWSVNISDNGNDEYVLELSK
ncbi:SirA family protein [Desulfofarcimen acetoxidans DSM 771]|uniref:SirA family protein n=1 Tax=Desulfofarcimen acetoxidans (strain ATCC 49208 / DSM 771 / KCTC 5769 / VKM B-1644 / 5575) TaxID=485916 RepID=C8VWC6_DESAS|nr:sulfurtransferase TusA family protein [Desulfofarcimen acetoxidans]ACV62478.1 SirA family protein [Desulfofarcimen acetoxidans DSM 771]